MAKIDVEQMFIGSLLVLVVLTILSNLISNLFPSIPVLKSGMGFILIAITLILIAIFTFAKDGNFKKEEITTLIIMGVILIVTIFALKHYFPDIFSSIDPAGIFGGIK